MNRNRNRNNNLTPETKQLIKKSIININMARKKKHNSNGNINSIQSINHSRNTILKTKKHITTSVKKLNNNILATTKQSKKQIPTTYISKLIKLYYNNDNVVNDYLATAHKITHIFPPQQRIIVIGDIHGDFEVALKCLILAKCIEYIEPPPHKTVSSMDVFFNTLNWIGGDTFIVQLGDQIDRVRPQKWDANDISRDTAYEDEGSTLEIFYLFYHLNELASKYGGRVFSIIGNHEIMNVDGDFRYVSKEEFYCFKEHLKNVYHRNSKFPYHSRTLKKNKQKYNSNSNSHNNSHSNSHYKLPIGYKERLYAFAPTGLCANLIAKNYYTMLQIGNWLFCHGSPTLHISRNYSIDLVNNIVALYLLGVESTDNQLEKHFDEIMEPHTNNTSNTNNTNNTNDSTEKSILWARTFGEKIDTQSQEKQLSLMLDNILNEHNHTNHTNHNDIVKATHIAIGHTPQFEQGINSICNGKVWRCDIGMSRAFTPNNSNVEKSKIQVLEILIGVPKVLHELFTNKY